MTETVDNPAHYQGAAGIKAIEVMERYGLGPHLFVAMKHLLRAGRKGDRLTDLRKARWYIDRMETVGARRFVHGPIDCTAASWCPPLKVADAFGLDGYVHSAVEGILMAALNPAGQLRFMVAARRDLAKAIAMEERTL